MPAVCRCPTRRCRRSTSICCPLQAGSAWSTAGPAWTRRGRRSSARSSWPGNGSRTCGCSSARTCTPTTPGSRPRSSSARAASCMRGLGPHTVDDALRDPAIPLETRRERGRREGIPRASSTAGSTRTWPTTCTTSGWSRTACSSPATSCTARDGAWRVVPVPGHAPAQIALFEERRRWAITADLAYDVAEPFLEYGYTLDPYGEHLASLERVAALEAAPAAVRATGARSRMPASARPRRAGPPTRWRRACSRRWRAGLAAPTSSSSSGSDDPRREQPPAVDAVDLALRARAPTGARPGDRQIGDDGVRRLRRTPRALSSAAISSSSKNAAISVAERPPAAGSAPCSSSSVVDSTERRKTAAPSAVWPRSLTRPWSAPCSSSIRTVAGWS